MLKTHMGKETTEFSLDPYSTSVDTVYRELRRMILHKKLVRGQKLPEAALAEQLNVSRTPVREALRRLAADGFVVVVPKNGTWVVAPPRKEVEDTYHVRRRLEGWGAAMAADNVTPLFIARLDEKIQEEVAVIQTGDIETYLEVSTGFHMLIAEASGNAVLTEYIQDTLARTFIYMIFHERYFDLATNPSLDDHLRLREAFASKNKELCVELAERHVMNALADLTFD